MSRRDQELNEIKDAMHELLVGGQGLTSKSDQAGVGREILARIRVVAFLEAADVLDSIRTSGAPLVGSNRDQWEYAAFTLRVMVGAA